MSVLSSSVVAQNSSNSHPEWAPQVYYRLFLAHHVLIDKLVGSLDTIVSRAAHSGGV